MVEKKIGKYVQCLRSDGGGEYLSNEFSSFLKNNGGSFHAGTLRNKMVLQRGKIGILQKLQDHLMAEKNMPHHYWTEAVSTGVYIMNRTPTTAVHDMTPEEKFIEKKLDLSHLKVFGCIAYVDVLDELQTKLDPKAQRDSVYWVLS